MINTATALPFLPIVRLHVLQVNMEMEQRKFDLITEVSDAGLATEFSDMQRSYLRKSISGMHYEFDKLNQQLYN